MSTFETTIEYLMKENEQLKEQLKQKDNKIKELNNSKEKFVQLFHNTNDFIFLIKVLNNNMEFVQVNDTACEYLGYTQEELIGMTPWDILLDEFTIANHIPVLLEEEKTIVETVFISKDNNRIPVELSSRVVLIANEKYILSIARDITKRKVIEKKLKESEERYRKLFKILPVAVIVQTPTRIIMCNKAAAKLVGVESPNELVGRAIKDFVLPNYHKAAEKRITDGLKKVNSAPPAERKIIRDDGEIIDVESSGTVFEYNGSKTIITIVRDITERKKIVELQNNIIEGQRQLNDVLEHDRTKSEFFGNMSHEFKTPLNVILGVIQLLELYNKDINELGLDKKIKIMKQNCYRLLRLVNNLIDITKLECGFMKLNLRKYDIVELLSSIVESIFDYAKNKGIDIDFHSEINEEIMAIDCDIFERVILNLLSNAIKFTKANGRINVSLYRDNNYILILVKDSGIGIPREKLDNIFQRFSQVDKSLNRNYEGSGIGLSIVKEFVELHKGRVSVESEIGKGSEFIVRIPANLSIDKKDETVGKINTCSDRIERINIEFSDIYF